VKSALIPEPFRAGTALPLSLGLHLALFGFLATATQCERDDSSLIDLSQVMEVAMVSLPKAEKLHRVTRAPDPPAGNTPKVTAPPPPPQSSDMALKVEEVPEEQGKPDNSEARKELMEQMARDVRRKELMESLRNAPVGQRDRPPADPSGIENASGSSMGAMGDPIIAAWAELVKATVLSNFSPLQTEPLTAIFQLIINRAGGIMSSKLLQSSGNSSFDAAARNAIRNTGRLPSPPAEKMPEDLASISITFSNTD
jgi:TonB family protein